MDINEARKIYTEIMRRAHQISIDQGSPTVLVKGSVIQASREKWEAMGRRGDADQWRKTVLGLARQRRGKKETLSPNGTSGTVTPTMSGKKRVQPNRNGGKGPWLDNYRELAMKYNALPVDEYLAEQWHCSPDTIGRIRGKLRMAGFEFERKNGVMHVTDRPKPAPAVVVALNEPTQELPGLAASAPLADTSAGVSSVTMKAILQMEAGTYRKLSEIEILLRELVGIWKS